MPDILCKGCGKALEEESNRSPEERKPCPQCGSLNREYHVKVDLNAEHHVRIEDKGVGRDGLGLIEVQFDLERKINGKTIIECSGLVGQKIVQFFHKYPDELKIMDRRKFEELVAELFGGFGYDVELTKHTRDGGRDIIAVKREEVQVKYLIECKRPNPGGMLAYAPSESFLA